MMSSRWRLRNVVESSLTLSEICHEREDSFVVFTELRPFGETYRFCRSLGAEMAAPATPEENRRLVDETRPFREDQHLGGVSMQMCVEEKKEKKLAAQPTSLACI